MVCRVRPSSCAQAEVGGCTLTWIEPHAFAQQPTMSVDYRVMLSFLELYEAILT